MHIYLIEINNNHKYSRLLIKCITIKLKSKLNATELCMKYIKFTMLITTYQTPPHLDFSCHQARLDRKSTRLNSSHSGESRMPSSA